MNASWQSSNLAASPPGIARLLRPFLASRQQLNVRIVADLIVYRQQWAIIDASRSHNDLIGRIAVKFTWKLCGFNGDLRCKRK